MSKYKRNFCRGTLYSWSQEFYPTDNAIMQVRGYNENTEQECVLLVDRQDNVIGTGAEILEMLAKANKDYRSFLEGKVTYCDICPSLKDKLLYILEKECDEASEYDEYKDMSELALINRILSITCEAEVLFYYNISCEEMEKVLEEQYTLKNLEAGHCHMFYDAADTNGNHTYSSLEEIKASFREAYENVLELKEEE